MNAADLDKTELLVYLRKHKLAVLSSCAADGTPHGALIGIAVTNAMELVFDTLSTSRKHENMVLDPRVAVTFSGPDEQTLQVQGVAHRVSKDEPSDAIYRNAYFLAWPDGRDRFDWPNLSYWRVSPRWARYSDFARGPLITELRWE